nr:GGDEF domain-containing protein [uncultured Ruminococcus sp.]
MKLKEPLLYWLKPDACDEVGKAIDSANIRAVHILGLIIAIMESVALVIYFIAHLRTLGEPPVIDAILRVLVLIVLSLAAFFVSDRLLLPDGSPRVSHTAIDVILSVCFLLVVLWGMYVSIGHYKNDEQMVTFYTVLLCIVVFFRLRPLNSALIIGLSSMVFYVILEFAVKPGKIQPINYTLFILILVGSSIVRYRVGVNSLNQKLRVEELNGALEDIANHDSLTHLYNRHSLSRMIPSYVGADICLAMLDINKFKFFNDTYGHKKGDEILCVVSDILTRELDGDDIFRYGGDEFLVVSRGCTEEEFGVRLERCNGILREYSTDKGRPDLSFSYGFVRLNAADLSAVHEAISRADKLLYENKKNAR